MVEEGQRDPRPLMTTHDIAARYRRTPRYVRERWVRHPAWRERVPSLGAKGGVRGGLRLYDAEAVEALVREWVWLPPEVTDVSPNRMLDQREIAAYTGFDYETVRSDASPRSNGRLGEPDEVREGVGYWKRSTVDERYWARSRRNTQRK